MVEVDVRIIINRYIARGHRGLPPVVRSHCSALVVPGLCRESHAAMRRIYHTHSALRIMVNHVDDLHQVS